MAIAIRENATPYMPYMRKTTVVIGDVLASCDHEFPVKPSYSACKIGAEFGPSKCSGAIAAIAPQASNPTSATSMRIQATWRHDFIVVFLLSVCSVDNACISSSIIDFVFYLCGSFAEPVLDKSLCDQSGNG